MPAFTISQQLSDALSRLTENERALLRQWSYGVFPRNDPMSGQLATVFRTLPPIGSPMTVYRGLEVDDWREVVYDIDHFVATATSPAATRPFGGLDCCFMEILLPPEAVVLPLTYEFGLSLYPKDMEVLLPRQGVFEVVGSKLIDMEQAEYSIYPPEIRAVIEAAHQKYGFKPRTDRRLFVTVRYLPNGRMTRSLAERNIKQLETIYLISPEN